MQQQGSGNMKFKNAVVEWIRGGQDEKTETRGRDVGKVAVHLSVNYEK